MATFEQQYKDYLHTELTALVGSEIKVVSTNDISLYAGPRTVLAGDEIFAITLNGQGTQLVNNTTAYTYQKSIFHTIYVPVNYLSEFITKLTTWANAKSVDGLVLTLTHGTPAVVDYSFSVKYSTPNTDGIMTRIGSVEYGMISLTGDVIYSNIALTFADEFKLKMAISGVFTEIKNILSWKWAPQPMGEAVLIGNAYVTSQQRNGTHLSLNATVLFDGTDNVHKFLKQLAYKPTLANSTQVWRVLDSTVASGYYLEFNGRVSVTIDGSVKALTMLTLTINVSGDPS